jgi:hypothetical protein
MKSKNRKRKQLKASSPFGALFGLNHARIRPTLARARKDDHDAARAVDARVDSSAGFRVPRSRGAREPREPGDATPVVVVDSISALSALFLRLLPRA